MRERSFGVVECGGTNLCGAASEYEFAVSVGIRSELRRESGQEVAASSGSFVTTRELPPDRGQRGVQSGGLFEVFEGTVLIVEPVCALPARRPRCFLRNLTFLGINMI